ncbi:MAG: hypothetical protein KatS3mg101_1156 [Patescibacteria group bacterium]|nr:MAG: hypothetical protein KatS3mg101_1156 [Patescibacteria group bacterium]
MKEAFIAGAAAIAAGLILKARQEQEKESFTGALQGTADVARGLVILGVVVVGVVLVLLILGIKKAAENPGHSLDIAEKGARVYKMVK